jgi:hypothetical protein
VVVTMEWVVFDEEKPPTAVMSPVEGKVRKVSVVTRTRSSLLRCTSRNAGS